MPREKGNKEEYAREKRAPGLFVGAHEFNPLILYSALPFICYYPESRRERERENSRNNRAIVRFRVFIKHRYVGDAIYDGTFDNLAISFRVKTRRDKYNELGLALIILHAATAAAAAAAPAATADYVNSAICIDRERERKHGRKISETLALYAENALTLEEKFG